MTDLRKEVEKLVVIGSKEIERDGVKIQEPITRKYVLKQMCLDDTLDCLPILGEIFGVSLFSIISSAMVDGNLSGLDTQIHARLFTPENKDAIKEFFQIWRKNSSSLKEMLKMMLKDGYYEVNCDDNQVIKKAINYDDFTSDDLMLIGELFIFGITEVNFKRFFDQLTNVQGSAEVTQ